MRETESAKSAGDAQFSWACACLYATFNHALLGQLLVLSGARGALSLEGEGLALGLGPRHVGGRLNGSLGDARVEHSRVVVLAVYERARHVVVAVVVDRVDGARAAEHTDDGGLLCRRGPLKLLLLQLGVVEVLHGTRARDLSALDGGALFLLRTVGPVRVERGALGELVLGGVGALGGSDEGVGVDLLGIHLHVGLHHAGS